MRTTRKRKMAAAVAALRRECASGRTLFYSIGNFTKFCKTVTLAEILFLCYYTYNNSNDDAGARQDVLF